MGLAGYATAEGTARFVDRFRAKTAPGHFRRLGGLTLSSIGLGTYLGDEDPATDRLYGEAIARALSLGCNLLDTAINYRCQRSERVIGQVLGELICQGALQRDEVVVATKGGFIPFDGAPPLNPPAYFRDTFLRPGLLTPEDLVAGCHCMTPRYLEDQIERSRTNLGLECIDIYYLHNPETQLQEISREEFHRRMKAAFHALEEAVEKGKIRMYGTATWTGYRQGPEAPGALSLETLVGIARDLAGENHHFKAVQLPYNLAMPEACTLTNQRVGRETLSLLQAAERLQIYVFSSASLLQGQLSRRLPSSLTEILPGLDTEAQRAIQFVRSTPGLGTALVGMKSAVHVEENLALSAVPPAAGGQLFREMT